MVYVLETKAKYCIYTQEKKEWRIEKTSVFNIIVPAGWKWIYRSRVFKSRSALSAAAFKCTATVSQNWGVTYGPMGNCYVIVKVFFVSKDKQKFKFFLLTEY